jgi:anhydro-N-acetylmuramic acid kinase
VKKKHTSSGLYVGLMSGTSMDSLDAALIDLDEQKLQLIRTASRTIPSTMKQQLLQLCDSFDSRGQSSDTQLLQTLDIQLAKNFSQLVAELLKQEKLDASEIQAIGSHGQTVFHLPPSGKHHGHSLQIGNPQDIADLTGISTVGDFRNADMRQGGQGAPLAPAFHQAMFSSTRKNRVILNIGGMANITVLSATGQTSGFDTGPGNVLMDAWCSQHHHTPFDTNGDWARQGTCHEPLLEQMLSETFFSQLPPKSTGRELFNLDWINRFIAQLDSPPPAEDIQHTLLTLTVHTIADAIKHFASDTEEIYVCGGGCHNQLLMEQLAKHSKLPVTDTSVLGVDPDWVEACAFAWLARQTLENLPGNLPSVTGAQRAVVLGEIFSPRSRH